MFERCSILLPVLPIELRELERASLRQFEATDVEAVPIWIGAGHVEGLDATDGTE